MLPHCSENTCQSVHTCIHSTCYRCNSIFSQLKSVATLLRKHLSKRAHMHTQHSAHYVLPSRSASCGTEAASERSPTTTILPFRSASCGCQWEITHHTILPSCLQAMGQRAANEKSPTTTILPSWSASCGTEGCQWQVTHHHHPTFWSASARTDAAMRGHPPPPSTFLVCEQWDRGWQRKVHHPPHPTPLPSWSAGRGTRCAPAGHRDWQ